jgi:hypothetical protein
LAGSAFEVERRTGQWSTFGGLALGSVEIVLGAIVLSAGSGNLRLVTAVVGARGLIGGTLLLLEGFKIRRSLRPVPCQNSYAAAELGLVASSACSAVFADQAADGLPAPVGLEYSI